MPLPIASLLYPLSLSAILLLQIHSSESAAGQIPRAGSADLIKQSVRAVDDFLRGSRTVERPLDFVASEGELTRNRHIVAESITVFVGNGETPSAAPYRVDDTSEVAEFLRRIASLRGASHTRTPPNR